MNYLPLLLRNHIENYNILIISSMFMFIPAYFAYINELYIHSIITNIATIISSHNWWQNKYTKRSTTVDIYYSRFLFLFYLITGSFLIQIYALRLCLYIIALNLGLLYAISCHIRQYEIESNILHFIFHLSAVVAMLITVSGH